MDIFIKNIILYDTWQNVSGFAELKNTGARTHVKLRHSLPERDLLLSLVGEGDNSHLFPVIKNNEAFEINGRTLDLSGEVVACLCVREGNKVTTLASGIINPKRVLDDVPINHEENPLLASIVRTAGQTAPVVATEIDELLRKVCTVDDAGRGQCELCPYRDYFFEFTLGRKKVNSGSMSATLLGVNEG